MKLDTIICGDAETIMRTWPDSFIDCCVTSPPYWGLRDYGIDGQLGLEKTPEEYLAKMVAVFREVRRVLKKTGTCWINMGDSYAGDKTGNTETKKNPNVVTDSFQKRCPPTLKPKDLCMMPHRLAMALQKDGWWIRSDIVWAKPNPMPESVTDRPTKSHEYIFLCTKSGNPLTWTNNKTGIGTSTPPLGTRGIEDEDWEWVEHSACEGKGCDKKRCVNGKIKSSFWEGHDYYYDADAIRETQIESNDARPRMGQGPNTQYKQKRNEGRYQRGPKSSNFGFKQDISHPAGKNKRDVWTISTAPFPEAHFATFPPKLIEPCILAGCPGWVCKKCGKARERIIDTELVPTKKAAKTFVIDDRDRTADKNDQGSNRQKDGHRPGHINKTTTTGWTDCKCNAGFDGGIVFDPFMGSGTTAVVAYENRRHYLGIELNPKYIDLGRIDKQKEQYALIE